MPKLHLKRTPEEEAAHRFRKKQRKEERRKRKCEYSDQPSLHRSQAMDDALPHWASSNDERYNEAGHEKFRNDLEENEFREKMFAAYEDEERLDSLEAHLNNFVHIPRRWQNNEFSQPSNAAGSSNIDTDDFLKMNPRYMDDDEYAEWIRLGMHRKTHPNLYAEQQRKKVEKAQRKEKEKTRKLESKRLEKLAEEERQQKKLQRDAHKRQHAKQEYEHRWKELLSGRADAGPSRPLRFSDIPWPILSAYSGRPHDWPLESGQTIVVDDLTPTAILDFLVSPPTASTTERDTAKQQRKDILRVTFLRFHPDKFEGRFMSQITNSEKDVVREGIGRVVRSLNALTREQT